MPSRGAVLVTGASSGIGEATAVHLAAAGFTVLAGVRREEDGARLAAAHAGVRPVILDVTDDTHIAAAAETVQEVAPEGLAGLVNNAGAGGIGPVETVDRATWEQVLSVNLVGTALVTRALTPALVRARGRIVNIGSVQGRLALPMFAPYATSKFGVAALTDVLRRELHRAGVRVVLVEPGVVATGAFAKMLPAAKEVSAGFTAEMRQRYGLLMDNAVRAAEGSAEGSNDARQPAAVAATVETALTAARPRLRYPVGTDAWQVTVITRLLPRRTVDTIVRRITSD